MARRASPSVTVACADCGQPFQLSRRNELEHQRHGKPHRCRDCRHPAKPPDPAVLAVMRRWWITTFTLEEIRSWPPL